jgi:DNA invertase Pin-like site-specific DNA recombinase
LKQQANAAALYLRLSRDDGGDAESNSISMQRQMLQKYAKEQGFLVFDEYIDDGISGTTFERPSFKRMIADIEDGKVKAVICKDLSRLGRNNALVAYYTELFFPDNDVRLIALNDSIDTAVGENEIMAFKSVINEYYARDISKKVRSSRRTMALNGQHGSGRAPYGYMKDPGDKHKLLVNEETAQHVRWIFQQTVDGLGVYQIAKKLYETGVLTPAAYEFKRTGRMQNGFDPNFPCDWHAKSVDGILRAHVYIGHIVSHRQTTKSFKNQRTVRVPEEEWIFAENMHEPIIDKDTFDHVQKILSIKERRNYRHGTNMFAGLLVCADCGKRMTFQSGMRMKGGLGGFNCAAFRHGNRSGGDRLCTPHGIGYVALQEAVAANINLVLRHTFDKAAFLKKVESGQADTTQDDRKALHKLRHRESELDILVEKVFEQNALGAITDSTFAKLYSKYQAEQADVEAKARALSEKLAAAAKEQVSAEKFLTAAKPYTEVTELTREILLDFIDKIVVHEPTGVRNSRRQTIVIHYRFIGRIPESEVSL